jgi:opacity protein-like surface antigen
MRVTKLCVVALTLLALTPVIAGAQDKKVHFTLGGGPTFAGGDLGNKFSTGWGPAIGVTVDANPRLGFQFEYAYRWFGVSDDLPIGATRFSANHQTNQLDFNLVATLTRPDSPLRAYVVAGPGAYHRKVEITEYTGTGVICDPYYYVCGIYPVEAVVGSRGGWDFGFNVGGGIAFPVGESSEFFVESRFHYVLGPDIQPTATPLGTIAATGGSTNGYYFPLTFGIRF